ncbi:MAG TPA: hypothetical protein VFZ61_08485 [Polyangiales bacterium]
MEKIATEVAIWWATLCVLASFNVLVWGFSSAAFMRLKERSPGHYSARLPHIVLSAIYVAGCAFRSLLPRADVQRIVLYDSWLSSVLVGRSVATIAELAFVAQWALLLREIGAAEEDRFVLKVSQLIVPLIVVAETCSWYAVLTTSYLGNAMEQSLWTFTAAMMAVALFVVWRRAEGSQRLFLGAGIVACSGFVAFMCTVDVPMYLTRWQADELNGRPYFSLLEGLRDVSQRWVVAHSYQDWREEIAWMTLYFSFAVWISLGLAHAPRHPKLAKAAQANRISRPNRNSRAWQAAE